MLNINYNLRNAKANKETQVNIVIRYGAKSKYKLVYPSGEKILPAHWNKKKQRANRSSKIGYPDYSGFNDRLTNLKSTIKNVYAFHLNQNNQNIPTLNEFRELITQKLNPDIPQEKLKDFLKYFSDYIDESTNFHAKNTIRNRRITLSLLKEYKRRIPFEAISLKMLNGFIDFLKEKEYKHNTIAGHVKITKTALRAAIEDGYNFKIPRNFKFKEVETFQIYLNEHELSLIEELDLSNNNRLANVRDLFLIGCWTGLRISDLNKLRKEDIKDNRILCRTIKTDAPVVIPVLPPLQRVLSKYKKNGKQVLPRKLTVQKFNSYIKEVGEKIDSLHQKIKEVEGEPGKYELIVSHTCRRSFATNAYLRRIPVKTIMEITTHKTEREFFKYIRMTPDEMAKDFESKWKEGESRIQKSNLRIA